MNKYVPDPVSAEFERLHIKYYGLVYSYMYKRLRCNASEAEDRTAEVFERAYRNLIGQANTGTFPKPKSWLMKIAQNVCSQFYIDTAEHKVFSLEHYASLNGEEGPPIDFEDDEKYEPENVTEQNELIRELNKHLAALSPEEQRAVVHHYLDGWTFDAISQRYSDRAPSTVGNDARRGIQHLRVRLNHMEH